MTETRIRRYVLNRDKAAVRTYRVQYEELLNAQQLEVVTAGEGPILVIAGAGSGKTRTLTYRVSRLVEDGIDPSQILLLTFTNKAAREMLRRVEELVQTDVRRFWGGTFHSVGNRILRIHGEKLGLRRNFGILDEEDAKEMMNASIIEAGIETLERRFPKGDVLHALYSAMVNTLRPLEQLVEEQVPHFLGFEAQMRTVIQTYQRKKLEANLLDFDDLLVLWNRLLAEHSDVADVLQRQFRHILVDEYQDTNRLQAEIVDRMAAARRNLMVVGDDAQSIYSFRGASFENILTFPIRYPDATICRLEINYRSTPQILELANHSIANNRFQFRKELMPSRKRGAEVAVIPVDDAQQQADFIAQRILELRDEGEDLDEIAVLYRSHYQSLELQMELSRRNIPYEVRSGVRFFESAHVKDVISFLRIIFNPSDELSWKRVAKLYPKIGDRTAAQLWDGIRAERDPLAHFLAGKPPLGGKQVSASLSSLRRLLGALSSEAMRRSPSEAIRLVVDENYAEYARSRFPNARARLEDLEQLAQYAMQYESVEDFLIELSLQATTSGEDIAATGTDDEKVVLSSVHQAKGLEWRNVFVIWLADGRFPSVRAMRIPAATFTIDASAAPMAKDLIPASELTLHDSDRESASEVEIVIPGEEEERRLFYVAITRARNELYLVHPLLGRDQYRMDVLMEPSRFLMELPPDSYEKWVIG